MLHYSTYSLYSQATLRINPIKSLHQSVFPVNSIGWISWAFINRALFFLLLLAVSRWRQSFHTRPNNNEKNYCCIYFLNKNNIHSWERGLCSIIFLPSLTSPSQNKILKNNFFFCRLLNRTKCIPFPRARSRSLVTIIRNCFLKLKI